MQFSAINPSLFFNSYGGELGGGNNVSSYKTYNEIRGGTQINAWSHLEEGQEVIQAKVEAPESPSFLAVELLTNMNDLKALVLLLENKCVSIVANFYLNHMYDRSPNEEEVTAYGIIEKYWSNDAATKVFLEGVNGPMQEKLDQGGAVQFDELPEISQSFCHADETLFDFCEGCEIDSNQSYSGALLLCMPV